MPDKAIEKSSPNEADLSVSSSADLLSALPAVNPFEDTFLAIDFASVDVFTLEDIPFFMGGGRRAVLDELMHLCQFSNNIVAVLGEAGVGKTALAYQSIAEFSDTAQCCSIQSTVTMTAEEMLLTLAKQLGVFVAEDASLVEMLLAVSEAQSPKSYPRIIIIVDDAHHLNNAVFVSLIALLQKQSDSLFHVLFLGDSSLLLRLDEMDKGEILVYDIPLLPFTKDELEEYLSFKLSAVGYEGAEVFDSAVVQSIWRDTHGIPASVNSVAHNLLLSYSLEEDDVNKLGLPLGYMAIVVVLLAALILAIFYVDDEAIVEPSDVDSSLDTVVEGDEITVSDRLDVDVSNALEPESALQSSNTIDESIESIQAVENTDSIGGGVVSSSVGSVIGEVDPLITNNESYEDNTVPELEVDAAKPTVALEPLSLLSTEPISGDAIEAEASTEDSGSSADQVLEIQSPPVQPSFTEASSSNALSGSVSSSTVSSNTTSSNITLSNNVPSSSIAASAVSGESPLTQDEEAVMFWPSDGHTLQVVAAANKASVEAFVARQSNRNLLRIIRFTRNNSPWYVVLVGVYGSSDEARLAVKNLPEAQISTNPWSRKISEIQGEIETFRRK